MTPEQQRIAIAEACGWKPDDDGAGLNTWKASYCGNRLFGLRPSFRPDGTIASYTVDCVVPDYLNDLNAMHGAEKSLTDRQHLTFRKQLWDVVIKDKHDDEWDRCWISATAAQRAEAFLRTLNLWTP